MEIRRLPFVFSNVESDDEDTNNNNNDVGLMDNVFVEDDFDDQDDIINFSDDDVSIDFCFSDDDDNFENVEFAVGPGDEIIVEMEVDESDGKVEEVEIITCLECDKTIYICYLTPEWKWADREHKNSMHCSRECHKITDVQSTMMTRLEFLERFDDVIC